MPAFPYEQHRENLLRTSPTNWMAFPGSTKPCIKTRDDWWNNMEYIKWEPLSDEKQGCPGRAGKSPGRGSETLPQGVRLV
jgi:hypothetical protein